MSYFSQKKNVFSWGKRKKVNRKLGVKSALILFIKTNLTNNKKTPKNPKLRYTPKPKLSFLLDTNITVLETGKYDFKSAETTEHSLMLYLNTAAEKCYCVTRKELLAIVKYVDHSDHYLDGREFIIQSNPTAAQ